MHNWSTLFLSGKSGQNILMNEIHYFIFPLPPLGSIWGAELNLVSTAAGVAACLPTHVMSMDGFNLQWRTQASFYVIN